MNIIETNALTKFYGKARGIKNVDLTVLEGDFFGFIGPNGAGKSTTIRLLLGLISPTSGNAKIFGKDCSKDKTEILKNLGYLPSEANFYHGMRVCDILKFSADLRKVDCSREAKKLCDRLELDVTKKVEELSLGNRKKVAIVCTLQHMPKLCILDEPTSGLDPLMQREFYNILQERNESGATIFLSSHILSEVQKYCKHAGIIRNGELLVVESVDKLKSTNAKRVTLKGVNTVPNLDHIKDPQVLQDGISFLFGGKPNELFKYLTSVSVTDITIAEPDLEEIFMHYYEKEVTSHDGI